MVVIKIGGSLKSTIYIKKWIDEIKLNRNTSFLLIFGGGEYANNIRIEQKEKEYSDLKAHEYAIEAMNKYTKENLIYLENFKIVKSIYDIKNCYKNKKNFVWMPSVKEVNSFNIPRNWDATSDSIALAISEKIKSPLLIIKSLRFNKKKYINSFFLKKNIVDKYFSENYLHSQNKISIASREKSYKLREICNYLLE